MFRKTYDNKTMKTVIAMAIPAIVESFFVAFTGLIDSFMVSSLGANAVAAVGLTTQPKFIGLSVFLALNVSMSALTARRLGEQKRKEANEIFLTAFLGVLVLALALGAVFVAFAPQIIALCGSSPETHDDAVTYLSIIMGGVIFQCIQMIVNAAQRGAGNTKITMRTNMVSSSVNILFNYLLINGHWGFPALGIRGAALATVLGTVVACLMSIISILPKDVFVSFSYLMKEKLRPTLTAVKSLIHIGYSVFLEQLLLRIGFLATAIMAADQGNYALAAHQVGMNIMGLSFSFGDGLQAAAVALIGKSLGEGNPEKAKAYGKNCQTIGGMISVVLAVIYFFGARLLMRLFFEEPEIVEIGVVIMRIIILAVLFQLRQVIYLGCLRAAGDTLFTAIVSTLSVTLIRTAVSYLCAYPLGLGIAGIWLGVVGDQVARYLLTSARFRSGKWTQIKI